MENTTKMPGVYKFIILLAVFLVLGFSAFFLYRVDLVESFFGIEVNRDRVVDESEVEEEVRYAILDIAVDNQNEAFLYINVDKLYDVQSIDIHFAKDSDLDVLEFHCEYPFDCIEMDVSQNNVFLSTVIQNNFDEELDAQLLLGKLRYEGSGNLYLIRDESSIEITEDVVLELYGGKYTIM